MKKILIISLTLFSFASGAVEYGHVSTRFCSIDGGYYTCGCQDTEPEPSCVGQITAVYCGSGHPGVACQVHTADDTVWEGDVIGPPQKLQKDK